MQMTSNLKPRMKVLCVLFFLLFLTCLRIDVCCSGGPARDLSILNKYHQDITLKGATSKQDREYLGYMEEVTTLCSIYANYIWVEIFSTDCSKSQHLASKCNHLYDQFFTRLHWRINVKMIGIGVGNNHSELTSFKKCYKVHFPLFSDPDFSIHRMLGEPSIPFLFLARKEASRFQIVSVFDSNAPARNQLQQLRKAIFMTTLAPFHKHYQIQSRRYRIIRNCCLWNVPHGEPVVCLLKGNGVKEIGMRGNWRLMETMDNGDQVQGWLPF